jgi:hypothetical protein
MPYVIVEPAALFAIISLWNGRCQVITCSYLVPEFYNRYIVRSGAKIS